MFIAGAAVPLSAPGFFQAVQKVLEVGENSKKESC
jgi:hypothetical protein